MQLVCIILLCTACVGNDDTNPIFGQAEVEVSDEAVKIEKGITVNGKTIDWVNFDKVYAFTNNDHGFKQILGVTWHDAKCIDYQLVCCTRLEGMELCGRAIIADQNGTMETDQAKQGSNTMNSYCCQSDNYSVAVHIASECCSKACFVYDGIDKGEDCEAQSDLILKEVIWQ